VKRVNFMNLYRAALVTRWLHNGSPELCARASVTEEVRPVASARASAALLSALGLSQPSRPVAIV
jgi:hypothetical protein